VEFVTRALIVAIVSEYSCKDVNCIGPVRVGSGRIKHDETNFPPTAGSCNAEAALISNREKALERIIAGVPSRPAFVDSIDVKVGIIETIEGNAPAHSQIIAA
jgi:hypothetical protein